MKTKLNVKEVKFDQEGYDDLVSKIEDLENINQKNITTINKQKKQFAKFSRQLK